MPSLSAVLRKHPRRVAILGAAVAIIIALVSWMALQPFAKLDPLITTPRLALETLSAKTLYYNGAARPWLVEQRPDLLNEDDLNPQSSKVRGMIQAVQNPKLFRQLDRQYRFDTLLLVGDPSQFRPLLDHLLETNDWSLHYLDHTSLVYKREATAKWTIKDLQPTRERLWETTNRDRALFLAQAAGKLLAIRDPSNARTLLDEAAGLDPKLPDVWSTFGQYRLALGQWKEAVSAADSALAIDDDHLPALAVKAQALYSMKYFSDAYSVSKRLVEQLPNDPGILFYHAKIAHEARAYQDEIRTLEHLVSLAEKENRPASGYRIYLAQAYASDGQADPALAQFAVALDDPDLPVEQRKFAQETSAQIRSRIGR